jgi:hypothetical protein
MMSQRQAAFRITYRKHISPWYHGWFHILSVLAIGFTTSWYAIGQISNASLAEWLVVPATFLLGNFAEYWIHRTIMHRPIKGFKVIYKLHALTHHQFLDDPEPFFDSHRDFYINFFPPYALVGVIALAAVPAALLYAVWSANAAWFFICTTIAVYINYETFHYLSHIRDDRLIRYIPFLNTIRRHHLAHHRLAVMADINFNATYPIADWIFGTTDLDRGLFGHFFNGYDTSHVKQELRWPMPTSSRSSTTGGPFMSKQLGTISDLKRSPSSLIGGIGVASWVFIFWLLIGNSPTLGMILLGLSVAAAMGGWVRLANF